MLNKTLSWSGVLCNAFLVVAWPFWMVRHHDKDVWLEVLLLFSLAAQVRDLLRAYAD